MIQAHIAETWIRQDLLLLPVGTVIRQINHIPAAPLFMLLMGYLAVYTRATSAKLLFRGAKVFFWGLLLNIGLNFHYLIKIFSGQWPGQPLQAILGVDILFLAGLSLIVISLIRRMKHSTWISLLLGFLIAGVSPWVHHYLGQNFQDSYLAAFIGNQASWSYFPLFPWLGYPLAGYAFGRLVASPAFTKLANRAGWTPMLLILPVAALGFVFNWNDLLDLPSFYHHGFSVYCWSLSFNLVLVLLLSRIRKPQSGYLSGWISFLGRHLTRAYVVQWLIIGNLATFFYQQLGLVSYFAGSIGVILLTTLILIVYQQRKSSHENKKPLAV